MSVPRSPSPFWREIDGVAVVNLDERQDRWDQLQVEAAALPGITPLTRISAVRGSRLSDYGRPPWFRGRASDARWAARAGCTLSHRKTLQHARDAGWKTFLVLEDDADLAALAKLDFAALEEQLFRRHTRWDVCYLGYSQTIGLALTLDNKSPSLIEAHGCYATHAYLIKTRAIDWVLDRLPHETTVWPWICTHRAIDRWYARNLSRDLAVYALAPALVPQRTTFSDIVNREVDYQAEFAAQIPRVTTSPLRHACAKRLRSAAYRLAHVYDWLRGLRKRVKGF